MAHAEADDLADIFFGDAPSQRKSEGHHCDNCDKCDKQATARDCDSVLGLRQVATRRDSDPSCPPAVASVAACRKGQVNLESEHWRGLSQKSQMSQRMGSQISEATTQWPAAQAMALVAWTDIDITRFTTRRARLLRWGWTETDADRLAERLVQRDREEDDRRMCLECDRLEDSGRCHWARMGRLAGADRRLVPVPDILQRCPSFMPAPVESLEVSK